MLASRISASAPRWLSAAVLVALLAAPARSAAAAAPDLRACADPALRAGLEREIGRLGLAPEIEERRLAVAVVDLSAAGTPRLAMLNGDEMMYAASLPKIAILLGAFVQAERGKLALDEPTLASLESRPDTRIYRKSGTWRQFHSDSALVEGRRRRYILVGIAEDPRGGEWLEKMAAPLNDLVDPAPSDPAAPGR